jgi:hypothetical protein
LDGTLIRRAAGCCVRIGADGCEWHNSKTDFAELIVLSWVPRGEGLSIVTWIANVTKAWAYDHA